MIQNTVSDVPELSHVQANADMDEAKGNNPFTYVAYMALLISAADTYEKQKGHNRVSNRRGKQQISTPVGYTIPHDIIYHSRPCLYENSSTNRQ
jgi:hypothetical protein